MHPTLVLSSVVALLCATHPQNAPGKVAGRKAVPKSDLAPRTAAPLEGRGRIVHALNRLGFGPRPGEVDRIAAEGLDRWMDRQLDPNGIDDSAVEAILAPFTLARESSTAFGEREAAVRKGNAAALRRASQRREAEGKPGANGPGDAMQSGPTVEERERVAEAQQARREIAEAGRQMVVEKFIRAVSSERQLQEVLVDFWSNHFNIDIAKTRSIKVADEYSVIRPHVLGKFRDLLGASAKSPAMLVYLDNFQSVAESSAMNTPTAARALPQNLAALRRLAGRGLPAPKAMLARVETLAMETGASPESVFDRLRQQAIAPNAPKRGLNENYARELLELHTVGVDGGYTQKDVQELARCLTGWTVDGGRYSGGFQFAARLHDNGPKQVMGLDIPAGGGIKDGELVLDMLARHPSTARHISRKLCMRLVSDDPPQTLVDRCAATWDITDGDLRAVVATIVRSPEFATAATARAKIKSPFEFAVSAVRALGATVSPTSRSTLAYGNQGARGGNSNTLEGRVAQLGQPLFRYAFPTGWPEESTKWVSSGALIARINFALALAGGKVEDVVLSGYATRICEGKQGSALIDALADGVIGLPVAGSTKSTLLREATAGPSGTDATARLVALVLSSPEFQRR
ncbi:MAG: DUF1800 domain-containing protein [Armatimonadota bacterium]